MAMTAVILLELLKPTYVREYRGDGTNFKSIAPGVRELGGQNRVFPIDFHHRPYNSVTHYRATL